MIIDIVKKAGRKFNDEIVLSLDYTFLYAKKSIGNYEIVRTALMRALNHKNYRLLKYIFDVHLTGELYVDSNDAFLDYRSRTRTHGASHWIIRNGKLRNFLILNQ